MFIKMDFIPNVGKTNLNNRNNFTESWLCEMPENIGNVELFDMIEYNIKERSKYTDPIDMGNGYKKIMGSQTSYYWYEYNNDIVIGIELSVKPQTLIVNAVAKNIKYKNKPPYATELYKKVLDDNNNIRVMSDVYLSNNSINVWKRLIDSGVNVAVYDNKNPGQSFKTINSIEELEKYIGEDDTEFQRFQFVLTSKNEILGEVVSIFNTRRMRELSGVLL